ncbi:MAG: M36 family metallopeptidase, partial [Pyrinomonadaceae bacterium]
MTSRFESGSRRSVLFALIVLAIITAIFVLPFQMRSEAAKDLFQRTESHKDGLPNYDIRTDKTAIDKLAGFRTGFGRDASEIADLRNVMVRGEQSLKQRVPTLKVEYNGDIRIPETIAPDVMRGRAFLTRPSSVKRSDILKDFLNRNTELIGASREQINDLKVAADYTNPDGNLSFVELNQEIRGVPVFRGEVKAGFTRAGEMIRVINNFAPGLEYASLSEDFGDPLNAVNAAAGFINRDGSKLSLAKNITASTDLRAVFGSGDFATTAEKMYFPTEPGVAVPAWRVLIWQPINAYYVIVDSQNGTLLWRKNITEDQTQSATYNIYANGNAMTNVAHSPFPFSPGPTSPNGQQGAAIARSSVTRIGNEAPYTFNSLGWMTDGDNDTNGNNVEAGLDRDPIGGVDAVNGRAIGSARTFSFPFVPLDPNTNTGDSPTPPEEPVTRLPGDLTPGVCDEIVQPHAMIDYQRASITNLFYINNWFHDETYRLGFTEAARNFQHVNFTGQGVGADRVSAEAQDCS